MDSSDLTSALAALAAAQARGAELEAKLSELRAADLEVSEAFFAAEKALIQTLASMALGEASSDDAEAARFARNSAEENMRGTTAAVDIVAGRIVEQSRVIASAEAHVAAVMAQLAESLLPEALANVAHFAGELGLALATYHRLDNCSRSGSGHGGFLSGQAAETAAGSPGTVLATSGIHATDGMLLPTFRDRIDDLKPRQLLAMLNNH